MQLQTTNPALLSKILGARISPKTFSEDFSFFCGSRKELPDEKMKKRQKRKLVLISLMCERLWRISWVFEFESSHLLCELQDTAVFFFPNRIPFFEQTLIFWNGKAYFLHYKYFFQKTKKRECFWEIFDCLGEPLMGYQFWKGRKINYKNRPLVGLQNRSTRTEHRILRITNEKRGTLRCEESLLCFKVDYITRLNLETKDADICHCS